MLKRFRAIVIVIAFAAASFILMHTVFYIGYVPSISMEPTLPKDSIIIGCRIIDELKCGDIIIFRHESKTLVKRIVASGGDRLTTDCKGTVFVNRNDIPAVQSFQIPADHYFVLGDNLGNSNDSRYWSDPLVSQGQIIAVLIYNIPSATPSHD